MKKIENSTFLIDVIHVICNLYMEARFRNMLTTDACLRVELVIHTTSSILIVE